ncbi:MAG: hypothetical protein H6831_05145 [Planctomycetes bacterium]|nr:hypothetical protein [Planctomycetota bacterium]MCB9903775.1 hypothetical protein [Planctomycetota bacterium]
MSGERHSEAPEAGPVAGFLAGDGRGRIPGSLPVISWREEDEHAFLDDLERCADSTIELSRRGVWHGHWAELSPAAVGLDLRAELSDHAALHLCWNDARPIVLPGILDDAIHRAPDEIAEAFELYGELGEDGGLKRWLKRALPAAGPEWRVRDRRADLFDAERDVEKVFVSRETAGRELRDLWWKSGRLSTFEGDDSLRLRISFGLERDDDASREPARQRAVATLAEAVLPGASFVPEEPSLNRMLEILAGEELFLTQHIAYWNAPEGGALFHHDAFDEPTEGGQRGVLYAQLAGRTAWLALSVEDLALRVSEFVELLREGELEWVTEDLFPRSADLDGAVECARDRERLVRELALPGCGRFAGLVNRGPEFTDFLANAGHAAILEAGDVILLPNYGLARTVMHSVFCADDEPTYAISAALRQARPDVRTDLQAALSRGRGKRKSNGNQSRRSTRRRD